ncbi:hypothetical protein [Croceicoccus sp. Ery15]|uniref:hypothetical protein n=1 Tax=Croceicoccus sp. Ery15 TaxID=1703338 RepID=UPI001E4E3561|nr:hypothetical protein [Croceicoccus sp. Ery15]
MIRVDLPYPHKTLWPNGPQRNYHAKARHKKSHRNWAWGAAKAEKGTVEGDPVPVRLIVHAKPTGPLPDRDNCVAALKAYQDGIAAAIGIDDKHFAEPTVEFAMPRDGRFVIEVGA